MQMHFIIKNKFEREKTMKTKKLLALLLAVVLMFSVVGCSTSDEDETSVFRFATATEPVSIDPHNGNAESQTNVQSTIYEGLVRRYDGEITAGIAESWDIDGNVYTFYLRESEWSDGESLVAQDFVDSWNLLNDTVTPMTQFIEYFLDEDGELMVEALDDYTLQVTLNTEVPFIMEYFASTVLVPVRIDAFDGDQDGYYQDVPTVVNGPYVLSEWSTNDVMVFVKNESYWNADAVSIDQIEIYTVSDENTQISMYETGEIDMVDVPASYYAEYEDQGLEYYEDGSNKFIQFSATGTSDETTEFLQNRNFIEALSYTIDREALIDAIFAGAYNAADEYVPSLCTGYSDGSKADSDEDIETPYQTTADLDKAAESLQLALDELGYTVDTMPAFSIMVSDAGDNATIAQYIQDVASQIGIVIEIDSVPSSTFWSLVMGLEYDYDFALAGFGPDVDDATTFLSSYTTTGGYGYTYLGWSSEEYDAIYEASWLATDEERAELLVQLEEILLSEGPVIPLYTTTAGWVLSDSFENINKNATGTATDFVFAEVVED